VHEKSILLPLLPITALAAWEPAAALAAPLVAAFSMYPLLERDGLALPYAACCLIYAAAIARLRPTGLPWSGAAGAAPLPPAAAAAARAAAWGGAAAAGALHALRAFVPPPARLPWLHDRLFISLAFAYIAAGMAYFNWRQWAQPAGGRLAGGGAAPPPRAAAAAAAPRATPACAAAAAAAPRRALARPKAA
jgi:alpha-1,3-glucosyltransferase